MSGTCFFLVWVPYTLKGKGLGSLSMFDMFEKNIFFLWLIHVFVPKYVTIKYFYLMLCKHLVHTSLCFALAGALLIQFLSRLQSQSHPEKNLMGSFSKPFGVQYEELQLDCPSDGHWDIVITFPKRSNLNTETSFGLPSSNYTGQSTWFFCKTSKRARYASFWE